MNPLQFYADLIEHVPLGLVVLSLDDMHDDSTFRFVVANSTARQLLGMPLEPTSESDRLRPNHPPIDPFPAFLKLESPKFYGDVIRSATAQDLGEIRYRNQRRMEKIIVVKAFPLPEQRLGVVLQDITDRKQTEADLEYSEQKRLFHIQQTPLAVIEWNLNREVVEWNPAAEKMFGYTKREVLGSQAADLIVPPHSMQDMERTWYTLFSSKVNVSSTSQNMTGDGRFITCEWHHTPLIDESGNMLGVMSLVQDITERRRIEAALLTSAIRYRQLFQASQDGVLILDAHTEQIIEANPFLMNLLGYSLSELLGKTLWDIGVLDATIGQTLFRELNDIGYVRYEDLPLTVKDGYQVDVEFVCSMYLAGDQAIIQCNIHDITDRKRTELELRAFTVQLKQSNQALKDFASIASHDLQEPLRKIQAFSNLLRTKCLADLSDEGQDYLERMQSAAQRMQTLINDLLTFSRITTKGQPFVPVNLAEVVQEVLSDLEIQLQQVGGQVEVGDLPTIEADPVQMRQLLQNLISNALKFHQPNQAPVIQIQAQLAISPVEPPDSVSLSLSNPTPIADYQFCCLQITDNGIGFDEKYLDRIFTMFQRLHNRSEFEGTGIGLTICRKIVERHGGNITATSQLGQGTRFTVMLPLRQTHRQSTPSPL
jgi:PAS domain S-box-containing protein